MSHSFLSQLGWEPEHSAWVSFQETKSSQTFPQADNASSANLPSGEVGAALQGWKAIQQGTDPHSSCSWDCCELQAAPQTPHNQGAPHTQLPSSSVLQFKTIYFSGQFCWIENDLKCIITCEHIFYFSKKLTQGFPLVSQHNDFLVHSG